MPSSRDPLDWYIEVCGVCGCQLGPGIGSRTKTGRCVDESHHHVGGKVVDVVAAARVSTLETALRAAARLADLPDLDAFQTYECEHGATLGQCHDEDGKFDCATQDDMQTVYTALAEGDNRP